MKLIAFISISVYFSRKDNLCGLFWHYLLIDTFFLFRAKWLSRLLCLIAVHCVETKAAEILVHILRGASTSDQVLQHFIDVHM